MESLTGNLGLATERQLLASRNHHHTPLPKFLWSVAIVPAMSSLFTKVQTIGYVYQHVVDRAGDDVSCKGKSLVFPRIKLQQQRKRERLGIWFRGSKSEH